MPLHLLGKKSWNVYNSDNIARVQRDEAEAKAREERNERRERKSAAAGQLQQLRNSSQTDDPPDSKSNNETRPLKTFAKDNYRKRRKIHGEDDTDRDIRLARADIVSYDAGHEDTSLIDSKGHLNLIPTRPQYQSDRTESTRNAQQSGITFSETIADRSGKDPWYNRCMSKGEDMTYMPGKDVWGNEDPRRRQRESDRMIASDPLLAIKKGVKQLRDHDRQRSDWMKQRERDLYEVERLARRRERRRHRHDKHGGDIRDDGGVDDDVPDGLNLDNPLSERSSSRKSSHHHGDKSHDREPQKQRSRRRSGSPDFEKDDRHRH